jgi:LuxR family transcriptional regulator, maltose regulon positive regulatory protein
MAHTRQSTLAEAYPVDLRSFPLSVVADDDEPARAALTLVRSLVISRILAGADLDVVQQVIEQREFGESEPLLLAGAALARSWLDITELALARAGSELAQAAEPELADVLSLALLNMATSRLRDEPALGLAQARRIKDLMGQLTAWERAQTPELSPLIDYYVAGFELSGGNLAVARWTLERGAGRFRQWLDGDTNDAEQLARAACAGQLAWIDAVCGDLRRASHYATPLLADRRADSGETGAVFAQLATAWTHLERGEVGQAARRLEDAQSRSTDSPEPLVAAAGRLTQVRLALLSDEPEAALRLLHAAETIDPLVPTGWFADQFLAASAEAWLAAGEPRRAIAALSPEPELAHADSRLILVAALRQAGDLPAAEHLLARVPSDPIEISLISQMKRFLLQAEVAVEQGNRERATLLLDRALRAAAREELRSAVGSAGAWLRRFVATEPDLSRRYSAFLASLPEPAMAAAPHRPSGARSGDSAYVVPLTTREIDVLRGLADYCSNEEIAADLVLSLNTVKTHMRSLFQKLSVTRRADAVRRGRALGLC